MKYRVLIEPDDPMFRRVQRWVMAELPFSAHRTINLRFGREAGRLVYRWLDDSRRVMVHCGAHPIRVRILRRSMPRPPFLPIYRQAARLELAAVSLAGLHALYQHLEVLAADEKSPKHTQIYYYSDRRGWGGTSAPARPLSSVVLAAGVSEQIQKDLQRFLDAEASYIQRGLPWHRGYLLDGPPGTGKTSLVRAIAGELGMDLYVVPLSAVGNDGELPDILGFVDPKSILLLEDIDTATAARDRDSDKPGVTMSGLLNALDGVTTPHGVITIMTSNRREVLDDAVVRPGRVDMTVHLRLPTPDQAERLFTAFYDRPPAEPIDPAGRTTAALVEVLKQHLDDPAGAEKALTIHIEERIS